MQKIMPLTDLQRTAGVVLADLASNGESVVITHRGRPAAVLLSVSRYEQMESDLERLDELELDDLIARSEAALKAGDTIPHAEVKSRLAQKFAMKKTRSQK